MKILIITIITFIFSTNLIASEWVELSRSDSGVVYIDYSGISFDKNTVKAWAKYSYDPAIKQGYGKEYNQVKILSKYNCANSTTAILQTIYYMDLEVISQYRPKPQEIIFSDVIPDTYEDLFLKYLCGSKPK